MSPSVVSQQGPSIPTCAEHTTDDATRGGVAAPVCGYNIHTQGQRHTNLAILSSTSKQRPVSVESLLSTETRV